VYVCVFKHIFFCFLRSVSFLLSSVPLATLMCGVFVLYNDFIYFLQIVCYVCTYTQLKQAKSKLLSQNALVAVMVSKYETNLAKTVAEFKSNPKRMPTGSSGLSPEEAAKNVDSINCEYKNVCVISICCFVLCCMLLCVVLFSICY
jgi:hypothetical protein